MLEIHSIKDRYQFPTIDFKFKNAGAVIAILTEFRVHVRSIATDLTPELSFRARVPIAWGDGHRWRPDAPWTHSTERTGGALTISARNEGWGAARHCQVVVGGSVIESVSDVSERTYLGEIGSGDDKEIIQLKPRLSISRFDELWRRYGRDSVDSVNESRNQWHDDSAFADDPERRIFLPRLKVEWHGEDEAGSAISAASTNVWDDGRLFLSKDGFGYEQSQGSMACAMDSDVTYCVILEPDKGAHERVYPLSRAIPAGTAERFHIMIGSPKSCKVSLHFEFAVDNVATERSLPFDIHIRNPRGSHWEELYADSDAISRKSDDRMERRTFWLPTGSRRSGPLISIKDDDGES